MMEPDDPRLAAFLERASHELAAEFAGIYDPATVRYHVHRALEVLPRPRVTAYRHIFAQRLARDLLHAAARWQGVTPVTRPQVLFVCVHNAGRSQMAAAFAEHMGGDRVTVLSAGSEPAEGVDPAVAAAMAEVGIDLPQAYTKLLSEDFVRASDAVITMGCGDACPVFPGRRYEDWRIEDPRGQPLEKVREIRDDIRARVEALLADLIGDATSGSEAGTARPRRSRPTAGPELRVARAGGTPPGTSASGPHCVPESLRRAHAAELRTLADDYRVGNLDMAGRTRLAVLLAARDGTLEALGEEFRIGCAAGLPGCLGPIGPEDAEIDHVVAQSKGGATVAENLQVLCASCNRAKLSPPP